MKCIDKCKTFVSNHLFEKVFSSLSPKFTNLFYVIYTAKSLYRKIVLKIHLILNYTLPLFLLLKKKLHTFFQTRYIFREEAALIAEQKRTS